MHDLAANWENLYKPVDRIPANPRQIPCGLATTQHDVTWFQLKPSTQTDSRKRFEQVNP
jgi:hypothetical protein